MWRLASEKLTQPTGFHVTMAAFDGIRDIRRDAGALAMNDMLDIQETS